MMILRNSSDREHLNLANQHQGRSPILIQARATQYRLALFVEEIEAMKWPGCNTNSTDTEHD